MGALLMALAPPDDPIPSNCLRKMVERSPHRGEPKFYESDGLSMAVQSLGWDASLARGRTAVVGFHGFVGNWDELRDSHGLRLDPAATHAEMIAAVFDELEEGVIPLLRGEFAVVIHDLRRNRVLAARDVVGCRPLYIKNLGDRYLVASEIRQVVAGSDGPVELNRRAFSGHLVHEPAVGTETLVGGVDCVMAGEIYSFSRRRSRHELGRTEYWRLREEVSDSGQDPEEWLGELEFRLRRAVRRWLPAHPCALTLSGGLDSSTLWSQVVALRGEGCANASFVRPLSLVFPGFPCDEHALVGQTLEFTGDRGLTVDGTRESAQSLGSVVRRQLDTVPYPTSYALHMMAEAAAGDGRRTLLTGHLGDHWFDMNLPGLKGRVARSARVGFGAILGARWAPGLYSRLRRWIVRTENPDDLDLLQDEWKPGIRERRWDRSLAKYHPQDLVCLRLGRERTGRSLLGWEQLCAGSEVEVRHPFADPDLIAHVASAPWALMQSGATKPALREVCQHSMPEAIVDRTEKVAFDCLVDRDRPSLADDLDPSEWFLTTAGIIDPIALDSLLDSANNEVAARNTVLWIEAVEMCAQKFADTRDRAGGGEQDNDA